MKLSYQNKGIPTAKRDFARVLMQHMPPGEQAHIRRETTTEEKPTEEKKRFAISVQPSALITKKIPKSSHRRSIIQFGQNNNKAER